jgi:hypothetical protein
MISKMASCYLICLAILYGLFTLSYNAVLVGNQDGITKVLATSDEDSGDSAGNSGEVSDNSSPADTSPADTSPADTSQSSGEDGPHNMEIECKAGMVLIDGECKEQSGADAAARSAADAAARSGGSSQAAAGSNDLRGQDPPGVLGTPEVGTAGVGTQQNEYSSPDSDKFHLNSEDIALELSSLTPLQIGEYPITDLSDNDLMLALSFLAPADLGKVLKNIPVQDLVVLKERLGETKFNEFLSKVSITDREVLENALALI